MRAAWVPTATRRDGPGRKAHGLRSRTTGVVYHSVVGSLATAFGVLDGPSVSAFHMTNAQDGRLFQHFPLGTLVYHARNGNAWSIGVENEGGPIGNEPEPLTRPQVDNLRFLSLWLVQEGWLPHLTRSGPAKSLWEHREISATACPSGRIPWAEIIRRAEEDDTMATAFKVEGQGTTVWLYNGTQLRRYATATDLARDRRLGLVPAGNVPTKTLADFQALRRKLGID